MFPQQPTSEPSAARPASDSGAPTSIELAAAAEIQTLHASLGKLATFGGLWFDRITGSVMLGLTAPASPTIQKLLEQSVVPVRSYRTAYSLDALEARTSKVVPLVIDLQAHGIGITDFGPDITTGQFAVGVSTYNDETIKVVHSNLGADAVVYDTSQEPKSYPTSRAYDGIRWYGGDFIKGSRRDDPSVLGDCSGGFIVHSANGHDYMSTAGHCFSNASHVLNGSTGYGSAPMGSGTMIGSVTVAYYNSSSNGYVDEAFVRMPGADGAGYLWSNTSSAHRVSGVYYATPGIALCADGAFSGERCYGTVDMKDWHMCHTYSTGEMVCHIFRVNAGTALAGAGDSGGAWFMSGTIPPSPTASVQAAGFESGGSYDAPCQGYPRGATACGYTNWVTDWDWAYNHHTFTMK